LLSVGGFFLNNQLTRFQFAPSNGDGPPANRPEALKRPTAAFAPILAFEAQNELRWIVGTGGGSDPASDVSRTLMGVLEGGESIQTAISRPAVALENDQVVLEQGTRAVWTERFLSRRGHNTKIGVYQSGLQGVAVVPGGMEAGIDSRRRQFALADDGALVIAAPVLPTRSSSASTSPTQTAPKPANEDEVAPPVVAVPPTPQDVSPDEPAAPDIDVVDLPTEDGLAEEDDFHDDVVDPDWIPNRCKTAVIPRRSEESLDGTFGRDAFGRESVSGETDCFPESRS
jgi:hypothetical protein